jgi:hypothetical protein
MNSFKVLHLFPVVYKNVDYLQKMSDILSLMMSSTACVSFLRINYFRYGFDILKAIASSAFSYEDFQRFL